MDTYVDDQVNNQVNMDYIPYDNNWNDDDRSIKMINYYINNNNIVEEQFIPITKILKEFYDEEKELMYCDSEYSLKTVQSFSNISDDEDYYNEDATYYSSSYESENDNSDNDQNEHITELVNINKFGYM